MKIDVEMDVNTDIYPMEEGAYYSMVLANSVNLDGTPDYDVLRQGDHHADGHGSLLDQYQYAMQGKIFKYTLDKQKM
jgi:DNA-directed RNA polymerase I, II, and III subunit RPABC3